MDMPTSSRNSMLGQPQPKNPIPPLAGLPLILDGNFFKVIAEDGLKVTGQCTLCPSRIMGLKTTTSNFNTHLKKMHPERHKLYEEYKIERGQTIKKRRTSHEFPLGVGRFSAVGQNQRRRLISNANGSPIPRVPANGMGPARSNSHLLLGNMASGGSHLGSQWGVLRGNVSITSIPNRRPIGYGGIQGSVPATSLPPTIKTRRKESDAIVFNFIVKSLSSTSLVESPHFVSFISGLCSNPRRVMSKHALETRINMQSMVKRSQIARYVNKADFVCIAIDAWTVTNDASNSFIAMTAHWIGLDLKLDSSLLTCRRFQDDLTYEKLIEIIGEILGIYNIPTEKICCLVTNNASNLLPTRIYKVRHDEDEDEEMKIQNYCSALDFDTVTNEDLTFYNLNSLLLNPDTEDGFPPLPLPSHYDCPTQTLIGVLCGAIFETISNPDRATCYIFQSALTKCQDLWRACSNKETGEHIRESCGLEILIPHRLNWASFIEAIICLLSGRDVLDDIFTFFGISYLEDAEMDFLEEYVKTMEPITEALTVLQDENELYMGSFVPTILTLKNKLEELCLEDLRFTKQLIESLLIGLTGPFTDIITLDDKARPLILASILHPQFKLSWIPNEKLKELKGWYLEEAAKFGNTLELEATAFISTKKGDGLEDELFSISSGVESTKSKEDVSLILMEFVSYLDAPCESLDSGQLEQFPNVRKLFITFNTAIASSLPVERLINFSEVSFAPSRVILKDDILENMMILKCN